MIKKIVSLILILALAFTFGLNVFAQEEWHLNYAYETHAGFLGADKEGAVETAPENKLMPLDSANKYNGKDSMRFNIKESIGWWVCFVNGMKHADGSTLKLTPYLEKGSLQFAVKGEKGGESFVIGFADNSSPQVTGAIKVTTTTEWQVINIPIQDLKDNQPFLDLDNLNGFYLAYSVSNPIKFWLADVRVVPTTPATTVTTTKSTTTTATPTTATTADSFVETTTEATTDADGKTSVKAVDGKVTSSSSKGITVDDGESNLGIIILIIVIALVIAGGVVAILMINKKRKLNEDGSVDHTPDDIDSNSNE